jgi:hypothetical protein
MLLPLVIAVVLERGGARLERHPLYQKDKLQGERLAFAILSPFTNPTREWRDGYELFHDLVQSSYYISKFH